MPSPAWAGEVRLRPPEHVLEIARVLERAGFEAWCVGGAVRDALLGHASLDWDLATSATPDVVRRLFRRTVPLGLDFGTVGVLDRAGALHEVTTFRRDIETDGRHAVVEFSASLDDDLARRDFTINAIAYSPITHELRDPFGGREDLATGVVRAVGDPSARMREDRLRALRAIRFAARLGFTIAPETWTAIVESSPYLGRLSAERVRQELQKTLEQVDRPAAALELWRDSGALGTLIPQLAELPRGAFAAVDCLPRAVSAVRPHRTVNRLAALCVELDPAAAERMLKGLRFPNADAAAVRALVAAVRRLEPSIRSSLSAATSGVSDAEATSDMSGAAAASGASDAQIRRWVADAGRHGIAPVFRLVAARLVAHESGEEVEAKRLLRALYRRALRAAYRDPVALADLALDGDDLRRAGIPPGPILGAVLRALLEEVLEDPARNEREMLLTRALGLAREMEGIRAGDGAPSWQRRGGGTPGRFGTH